MEQFYAIAITIIAASTPLLIAAIGELVVERSGVLNLGVEGMMIMGAVTGFGATFITGNPYIGLFASIFGGALMALLFGFLTLTLLANQVATGLAVTLLGVGLSSLLGEAFVGQPIQRLPSFYGINVLIIFSFILVGLVSWFLFRTRPGLMIRAVGDNHTSAHAMGFHVVGLRYACVVFGGGCAGLAGGYLSVADTPQWVENMTAGRGWIALALVVFATWLPKRVIFGAYLFGTISILSYTVQTFGWGIPSQLLSCTPYLVTIVALVVISGNRRLLRANTPACLGQPFVADR
ncbi:ABC transporter permease [Aestuariivirga litoralis]|uniref:ABC transporter permease n=1 Tax=Aestuariivirga litoralis TaxID=2650924 RepID=UPI0018C824D3|nr:ABC transporter permease [Aestuariivirga litoralis]MBG1232627.1 ABC transporter permease [Aestuariivirga litoralis]